MAAAPKRTPHMLEPAKAPRARHSKRARARLPGDTQHLQPLPRAWRLLQGAFHRPEAPHL
eukprot:11406078-Alexandrium_andersonii.AAC.1